MKHAEQNQGKLSSALRWTSFNDCWVFMKSRKRNLIVWLSLLKHEHLMADDRNLLFRFSSLPAVVLLTDIEWKFYEISPRWFPSTPICPHTKRTTKAKKSWSTHIVGAPWNMQEVCQRGKYFLRKFFMVTLHNIFNSRVRVLLGVLLGI